jgi:Na+/H+ antiporter NhaD/arsenite permease-like protein
MTLAAVVVFAVVYAGMVGGGLPFLQLDRTGIALLGAIALVAFEVVSPERAAGAVHLPTMFLLFSFMVVSAHLQVSGFYGWVTRWIAELPLSPPALLAALMVAAAVLSAVFSNDVVCLAMAPILVDAAARRGLAPVPFLLGLACAANVGSAATLIGNPQNMLIGSALRLSFSGYFLKAIGPVFASLAVAWAVVAWQARRRWRAPAGASLPPAEHPRVNPWQTAKGLALTLALLVVFLDGRWPHEVAALTAAGLLLLSRKMHSQEKLGLVDWELLVLFFGLFVVNHAFEETGIPARFVADLAAAGFDIVSNVPAVMLLLPWAKHPDAGALLALVSTFAGNLLVVGSIANIIVVDAAAARGVRIDWRAHARVGVPVTLATLAVTALFLAM